MSQKQHQDDAKAPPPDGASTSHPRRRKRSFRNVVLEVMKLHSFRNYMEPVLEPLIRRVVKEEVELALKKHLTTMKWNSGKEMLSSESRILQLQFLCSLSLPVFTGTRIEGDDCNTLKVALIDADSGNVVSSGLESSAKVEIVVLEGDFDGDEGDSWTLEEFKNNIVREREGKKPLLNGDSFLNLKEGIGFVGDISFTDNSSWTRSRKFRLGARVVDNCGGIRVKEAKTESFIVRDHRGELYKKHYPPSLFDEVWRLEKIGKEGAFHKRLSREKVKTVRDFLILHFLDPTRLRRILGTGMSAKMWEVTVEHARACVLDDKVYLYCPVPPQRTGVVFNVVGQVLGLLSDCTYRPADKISETEKADAQKLIITAFQHWEEVTPYEDEASLINGSSCLSDDALYHLNSPMMERSDSSTILATNKKDSFGHPRVNASPHDIIPSIYSMGAVSSLDEYGLPGIESMDLRFDQPLSFQSQLSNSLVCDTDSLNQAFCDDDNQFQFFDTYPSSFVSQVDPSPDPVNCFLFPRTAMDKAHRRWKMLSSVIKWLSLMLEIRERCHPVFNSRITL